MILLLILIPALVVWLAGAVRAGRVRYGKQLRTYRKKQVAYKEHFSKDHRWGWGDRYGGCVLNEEPDPHGNGMRAWCPTHSFVYSPMLPSGGLAFAVGLAWPVTVPCGVLFQGCATVGRAAEWTIKRGHDIQDPADHAKIKKLEEELLP